MARFDPEAAEAKRREAAEAARRCPGRPGLLRRHRPYRRRGRPR